MQTNNVKPYVYVWAIYIPEHASSAHEDATPKSNLLHQKMKNFGKCYTLRFWQVGSSAYEIGHASVISSHILKSVHAFMHMCVIDGH